MNITKAVLLEKYKKAIQSFFVGKQKLKPRSLGLIKKLTDASSTILFFCIYSKEDLDDIRKLLKEAKMHSKPVMAYVFNLGYETLDVITDKSVFFFNLHDFTIFGKMKDDLRQKIENDTFELMVSFVQLPDPFCLHIISRINADLKVGIYHSAMPTVYDLTLKTDVQKIGVEQYNKQVVSYLDVLNIEGSKFDFEKY